MRVLSSRRTLAVVLLASAVFTAGVEIASTDPDDERSGRELSRDRSRQATDLRVVRSWRDTVKIRGRDEPRSVEIVFDPGAGVARRRIYDTAGDLVSDEELADQPQPSTEEIADAVAMVRRDPELGSLLRRKRAVLHGGPLLREAEGEPCGPGSRCVYVFMVSESGWNLHRLSAVDLRRGRIAHPNFRHGRVDWD